MIGRALLFQRIIRAVDESISRLDGSRQPASAAFPPCASNFGDNPCKAEFRRISLERLPETARISHTDRAQRFENRYAQTD
jgi:hypothetical protein